MLRKIKQLTCRSIFSLLLLTTISLFGTDSKQADYPKFYHSEKTGILKNALQDALENAKKSILIFTFTFSDTNLIDLLNKKADEGLEVTIFVDRDHTGPILTYGSKKLNIQTRESGDGRLHHKILLIDDKEVWIGSANFTTPAYNSQENLMIKLSSKLIAKAILEEKQVLLKVQDRINKPEAIEIYDKQIVSFFLLPHTNFTTKNQEKIINNKGKDKLFSLIKNAKNVIFIAMMVWTDTELQNAVIAAHKRGVRVEVIMSSINNPIAKKLRNAGIFVTTSSSLNFMHNKFMWIDYNILVNGSANWSKSSFSRNDESFLVLENLTYAQVEYLENYWFDLNKLDHMQHILKQEDFFSFLNL